MLNFVENLLENERDPRSGPMNDQDHSLSLSDPDRSLVLSHFLTNFLQNVASCYTAFRVYHGRRIPSPDMNPIENVWGWLVKKITKGIFVPKIKNSYEKPLKQHGKTLI
jgi:transposase